jgi:hypothetical protein
MEDGSEYYGPAKGGEFIDELGEYQLLEEYFAIWSYEEIIYSDLVYILLWSNSIIKHYASKNYGKWMCIRICAPVWYEWSVSPSCPPTIAVKTSVPIRSQ